MKQIHSMILLVFAAGCGGGSGPAPVDPPIVILPPPLAVDEVQTAEGV